MYYLSNSIKDAEFFGIDIREDLLAKAKQEVSDCNFILGDISDSKTLPKMQFDIAYMTGVLSIFDDYETVLDRFVTSRMPDTRVKLKLRKNKKIEEVILKLGSFDDKIIARQSNLIEKHKYTKNQVDVWIKEWKN